MATQPTLLVPSALGTKEYWDAHYSRSLSRTSLSKPTVPPDPTPTAASPLVLRAEAAAAEFGNFEEPHASSEPSNAASDADNDSDFDDDPGTTWFTDSNAEQKMTAYLRNLREELLPRKEHATVLDLGTGNGGLLFRLRNEGGGFKGKNMAGVDYSEGSVRLARRLQEERRHKAGKVQEPNGRAKGHDGESGALGGEKWDSVSDEEDDEIHFEIHDILSTPPSWLPPSGFDVVLDKGTFDAISLSEDIDQETGKRACERYAERVADLVKRGGLVLVTSCNWTEEELVDWFTRPWRQDEVEQPGFEVVGRIEYKRFKFGGVEGQAICSVCFRRS